MSETKDRFGLTEKRRAELLSQIPTIGQNLKDRTAREADYDSCAFVRDLCEVAKVALSPPPLDEPVDLPTALQPAADGYPVQYRLRDQKGTWFYHLNADSMVSEWRILPKPAPKPKLISNREALCALVVEGKAVREWIDNEDGPSRCWAMRSACGAVCWTTGRTTRQPVNLHSWFGDNASRFFLCDETTGEPLETE